MKLAVMQPYFFPYIGYFQLVNAVDKFVFYDDVQFIKGGWINRNYLLERGEQKSLFTLHLDGASVNKKINEIRVLDNSKKLIKTIEINYSRAPFFKVVFPVIEEVIRFASQKPLLSEISSFSVSRISEYLGLETKFVCSSEMYHEVLIADKVKRLISLCRMENADTYINLPGGADLYNKEEFEESGIVLKFIKSNKFDYKQFNNKFIPNLSIIDVIMFNSQAIVNDLLNNIELE